MRIVTICAHCFSKDIDYLGNEKCFCNECEAVRETIDKWIESPYERTRSAVYATGNRWAIENFNATH